MPRLKNKGWEDFAKAYVSRETYLNGLQSYATAYKRNLTTKSAVDTCKSNAYKLLTNPYIQDRIKELMEKEGFDDASVDLEHLKMLKQDVDFKSKMAAIKEYNALKKRTSTRSLQVNILNYEQFLANVQINPPADGGARSTDQNQLHSVPALPPENQRQKEQSYPICAEWSPEDLRENDPGPSEPGQTNPVNSTQSQTGGDHN